jgi:hypothetical protein
MRTQVPRIALVVGLVLALSGISPLFAVCGDCFLYQGQATCIATSSGGWQRCVVYYGCYENGCYYYCVLRNQCFNT